MKMLIQELEKYLEPTEKTQMFDENEKKVFVRFTQKQISI